MKSTRRQFIKTAVASAAGSAVLTRAFGMPSLITRLPDKPNSVINGVNVGANTYCFRSMPAQDVESYLKYYQESGISFMEVQDFIFEKFAGAPQNPSGTRLGAPRPGTGELTPEQRQAMEAQKAYQKQLADWRASVPMDKYEQLRKMYNGGGVNVYAWKLTAFTPQTTDAEIDYSFRVAKAIGANQVLVEFPADASQTARFGKFADKHKINMGYHGHLQQSPTLWDKAISESKYNGLNCDFGHYVATGQDPLALIREKHDRIWSAHLKDRKNKEHGGTNMPWGQGDTPIVEILQTVRKNKYTFPLTMELEYPVPADSTAVKEIARCLEYARKALTA